VLSIILYLPRHTHADPNGIPPYGHFFVLPPRVTVFKSRAVPSHSHKLHTHTHLLSTLFYYRCVNQAYFLCSVQINVHDHSDVPAVVNRHHTKKKYEYLDFFISKQGNKIQINRGRLLSVIYNILSCKKLSILYSR